MEGLNQRMFAAGAARAAAEAGMSEKDANAFSAFFCKAAAMGWNGEDDTFWSRNKGWIIPTGIGALAFWLGADAGRHGRPDRGIISNAGSLMWNRVKALMGIPDSALWDTMTKTVKPENVEKADKD